MSASPTAKLERPTLRVFPEDFVVDEIPLYPACGEGGHTYLHVEKRLLTTDEVARHLADAAGVASRDVGFAGRKDRRAVTRQWFSVPGLGDETARAIEVEGLRILEARAHGNKLRPGHLAGNRFRIVVRGIDGPAADAAASRLTHIVEKGLANRFGKQRFGRDGRNAERGLELLRGEKRWRNRRMARLMVSALQSAIFNRVLELRPWPLDQLVDGDVVVIHASGGQFLVEDAQVEGPRAAAFEISATGPIHGKRMRRPAGEVAAVEARALAELGVAEEELGRPPFALRGERRPLRVRVQEARAELGEDGLVLVFRLPPGTYATTLLEALVPDLVELDDRAAEQG